MLLIHWIGEGGRQICVAGLSSNAKYLSESLRLERVAMEDPAPCNSVVLFTFGVPFNKDGLESANFGPRFSMQICKF